MRAWSISSQPDRLVSVPTIACSVSRADMPGLPWFGACLAGGLGGCLSGGFASDNEADERHAPRPSDRLSWPASIRPRAEAHARLFDFLRIPSVSAQPAHAGDCRVAAAWAADHLRGSGFTATVHETGGHPVVIADHPGTGAGPHLLYYGHYDVQPAEPVELWTSPAFEPTVVDGPHGPRVVARGAVDDKGQVSMWLEAFRAWHDVAGGPALPHHRAAGRRGGGRHREPAAVSGGAQGRRCARTWR